MPYRREWSGKSTILKAIMGLTPIPAGSILIDEQLLSPSLYEKIAFVPDHLTMPTSMKISEAIRFMADFYESWNPKRASELMQFLSWSIRKKSGTCRKELLLNSISCWD